MMPLEGIKVLDLTRMAPGPYCTMILGDMGADILKIEEPGPPAEGRRASGSAAPQGGDEARRAAFNALGRNKRSIALNLKAEEARQILYKLAETADVVVEGFRSGVTARLGVDYDTLCRINPRIVYCSLTGFGQNGPYRLLAGHDINYISIAGALGLIGDKDRNPAIPSNIIADFAAGGMHAAIGILCAIIAREKTGRGQYVDIAMVDGVISLLASLASGYFATGVVPRRGEMRFSGTYPYYTTFRTKDDKWISVGSLEPYFYENLCRTVGREDLIPYQNDEARQQEIMAVFEGVFRTKTRDEWFQLMCQTDQCAGPVYTMDEVFEDPHVKERQMVVEIDHPTHGKIRQVGVSIKMSDTPGQVRSIAPAVGQHTEEVLAGLGYTKERIDALRQAGVVK